MPNLDEAGPPFAIPCLFPLKDEGTITLYEGPLQVQNGGTSSQYDGALLLNRDDNGRLYAHFSGPFRDYKGLSVTDGQDFAKVEFPEDLDFYGPSEEQRDQGSGFGRIESTIPVSSISGGQIDEVDHLLIGCSTYASPHLPRVKVDSGSQAQQPFKLPGWDLILALVKSEDEPEWVIKAVPDDSTRITKKEVDRLGLRLFNLLSFLVSREVGIGPVVGLDGDDEIVWAHFTSGRQRPGRPGFRWCDELHMGEALEATATGYSEIAKDRAMEEIVGRSIEAFTFSNGSEVVDIRIPIACTALETLAWTFLRRWKVVGRKEAEDMPLAVMLRRLLTAADIPTGIPDHCVHLAERVESNDNLKVGDAPDALANVRNRLVHPPQNTKNPEWPSGQQQVEAWQLSTWYLELVLLLWLRYDGFYLPRVDIWNGLVNPTPVPWSHDRG